MRALSVRQPWAELIASGRKTIEVRSRRTHYRGPLLICAGVAWHHLGVSLHGEMGERGVLVCSAELVDCRPLDPSDSEAACFDVAALDRPHFAWVIANVQRIQPVRINGQLGLFIPSPEVLALLSAA